MIIDIHRHMWSSSQRHPAVRKIAHDAPKLRYWQPDEIPLVPDVDATSDEIVAEMDGAALGTSHPVLRHGPAPLGRGTAFRHRAQGMGRKRTKTASHCWVLPARPGLLSAI